MSVWEFAGVYVAGLLSSWSVDAFRAWHKHRAERREQSYWVEEVAGYWGLSRERGESDAALMARADTLNRDAMRELC